MLKTITAQPWFYLKENKLGLQFRVNYKRKYVMEDSEK